MDAIDHARTRPPSVRRHALVVRLTHWVNVVALTLLLGSGLQIFNAHPALYWGERSDPGRDWLAMEARPGPQGEPRGVTRLLGRELDTTGLFGSSGGEPRGFPAWATIPGPHWLAMGRRWHLFCAWLFVLNGLAYLGYALAAGHLRRDLLPGSGELRGLGRSLRAHLSLRRLRAESAHGYNSLQKLSYLGVLFILAPLAVFTGLAMSPWLASAFPGLVELFGGRQSARSIHFLAASAFVAFVVVHLGMVLLVGPVSHTRAMITGWLRHKEVPE